MVSGFRSIVLSICICRSGDCRCSISPIPVTAQRFGSSGDRLIFEEISVLTFQSFEICAADQFDTSGKEIGRDEESPPINDLDSLIYRHQAIRFSGWLDLSILKIVYLRLGNAGNIRISELSISVLICLKSFCIAPLVNSTAAAQVRILAAINSLCRAAYPVTTRFAIPESVYVVVILPVPPSPAP